MHHNNVCANTIDGSKDIAHHLTEEWQSTEETNLIALRDVNCP